MKKAGALAAAVLALILAAVGLSSLWLGRGIKAAVEAFAPEILGAIGIADPYAAEAA